MSKLIWDVKKERVYELGVDQGVLYLDNKAYVWNGLTSVSESPDGGEPNDKYADNMKYFSLTSAENYKATVEAFTYPDEFAACDGSAEVVKGVYFGQQSRKPFDFSYRTKVGNAEDGDDAGYKLHLVYGCKAAPSDKGYETVNDSPDAITFSWEFSATPVTVKGYKPVASVTIDSTAVDDTKLKKLEDILYGTDADETAGTPATEGRMPTPAELIDLFTKP